MKSNALRVRALENMIRSKPTWPTCNCRMKDLAAVYAALEDKTIKANVDIEDLTPLTELLRDE